MPASAASALQQGIGKPLLLGPTRSIPFSAFFANLTPDGVFRVAGFAWRVLRFAMTLRSSMVHSSTV
jgi:hypothetical protein